MNEMDDKSKLRRKPRFSHTYLKFMVKINNDWESIKVQDWSEHGFNFFCDHLIESPQVNFKKENTTFSGLIVSTINGTENDFLLESQLNLMLLDELKKSSDNDTNEALQIADMIRTPLDLERKKDFLISKGYDLTDERINALIGDSKRQEPLYRYGVNIEGSVWKNIVHNEVKASSELEKLEDEIFVLMEKIGNKSPEQAIN